MASRCGTNVNGNLPSIKAQPLVRRRKKWYLIVKTQKINWTKKKRNEDVSTRVVSSLAAEFDWLTNLSRHRRNPSVADEIYFLALPDGYETSTRVRGSRGLGDGLLFCFIFSVEFARAAAHPWLLMYSRQAIKFRTHLFEVSAHVLCLCCFW